MEAAVVTTNPLVASKAIRLLALTQLRPLLQQTGRLSEDAPNAHRCLTPTKAAVHLDVYLHNGCKAMQLTMLLLQPRSSAPK